MERVPNPQPQAKPAWLADRIAVTQRAARRATCPRCNAPVLAGLDGDTMATHALADPAPVGHIHAVAALLDGRPVYGLLHGCLEWLTDLNLSAPGGPAYPLHIGHQCPPKPRTRP